MKPRDLEGLDLSHLEEPPIKAQLRSPTAKYVKVWKADVTCHLDNFLGEVRKAFEGKQIARYQVYITYTNGEISEAEKKRRLQKHLDPSNLFDVTMWAMVYPKGSSCNFIIKGDCYTPK